MSNCWFFLELKSYCSSFSFNLDVLESIIDLDADIDVNLVDANEAVNGPNLIYRAKINQILSLLARERPKFARFINR